MTGVVGAEGVDDFDVTAVLVSMTAWPSDLSWSTKESTSLDFEPNFIALRDEAGLGRGTDGTEGSAIETGFDSVFDSKGEEETDEAELP